MKERHVVVTDAPLSLRSHVNLGASAATTSLWSYHDPRRREKKSPRRIAESSAKTSYVTSASCSNRGSTSRLYREPTAPAFSSMAPITTRAREHSRGSRAHDTRFERHVRAHAVHAPRGTLRPRLAQGHDSACARGVLVDLASVLAHRDDRRPRPARSPRARRRAPTRSAASSAARMKVSSSGDSTS
jgi:hypothetical protein